MPAGAPIRLGSAVSGWTFESGSSVETSASGIQSCSVKALWPVGSTVLSNLPAAGAAISTIVSGGYVPSGFLLDYTGGGPAVEYIEGTIARASFKFVRQDPNASGPTASRQVHLDSIINYKSILSPYFNYQVGADGQAQDGIFGFPEPVCTVTYNTTAQPGIGSGGLSSIYALPGSSQASGFPPVPEISVPFSRTFPAGAIITYFNGTAYVTVTLDVPTTFSWAIDFRANSRGWQLQKMGYTSLAANNFYDVNETWRQSYFFVGVTFISAVPPP